MGVGVGYVMCYWWFVVFILRDLEIRWNRFIVGYSEEDI